MGSDSSEGYDLSSEAEMCREERVGYKMDVTHFAHSKRLASVQQVY